MANTTGKKFGGRKKGTPNKANQQLREWIGHLIDGNRDLVEKDLKKLSPKDRMDAIIRLLEYKLPRLNRTEIKETTSVEDFLEMTPQERQQRIQEIQRKLGQP